MRLRRRRRRHRRKLVSLRSLSHDLTTLPQFPRRKQSARDTPKGRGEGGNSCLFSVRKPEACISVSARVGGVASTPFRALPFV